MGKNSLNNIICHLSWLKKLSPAHSHPLKTIREFWKPYELLFSELESLVKCNHKIRVQECYGDRAMSCPWHGGGVEAYGGPLSVDMQPYGCFIYVVNQTVLHSCMWKHDCYDRFEIYYSDGFIIAFTNVNLNCEHASFYTWTSKNVVTTLC